MKRTHSQATKYPTLPNLLFRELKSNKIITGVNLMQGEDKEDQQYFRTPNS